LVGAAGAGAAGENAGGAVAADDGTGADRPAVETEDGLVPVGDFDAVVCPSVCGASDVVLSGAVISAPQRGQRHRCPAWYGGTLTFPPHCGQEIRIDELP